MRYYKIRFDIWICFVLSFLLTLGLGKGLERLLPLRYDAYVKKNTVADGEIGGKANQSTFQAQNVEDMLSHDTFTVVLTEGEYRDGSSGFYRTGYLYAITLPSGERVAACINGLAVQYENHDTNSGDSILPVGKIVYEDLASNERFMDEIEEKEKLSYANFYIDMSSKKMIMSEDNYVETTTAIFRIIALIILFPLIHSIGAKIGIFPRFFASKEKRKPEWK